VPRDPVGFQRISQMRRQLLVAALFGLGVLGLASGPCSLGFLAPLLARQSGLWFMLGPPHSAPQSRRLSGLTPKDSLALKSVLRRRRRERASGPDWPNMVACFQDGVDARPTSVVYA